MAFALYLVGFVVFISGLAWIATLLGVADAWVTTAAVILFGAGLVTALVSARREPPAP